MKKMQLNLNELKVETFEAGCLKNTTGTVKGNKAVDINTKNFCIITCPAPECVQVWTDDDPTCNGISCNRTCSPSCNNCSSPWMFC